MAIYTRDLDAAFLGRPLADLPAGASEGVFLGRPAQTLTPAVTAVDCTVATSQAQTTAAVASNGAHRYWRIYATANGGDPMNRYLGEVTMAESIGGADVTGSGTASANTGSSAAACFDNNTSSVWVETGGVLPVWVAYDFGVGAAKDIRQITIAAAITSDYKALLSAWKLQWSDDASAWTDSGIEATLADDGWAFDQTTSLVSRLFPCPEKRAWRIRCTSATDGPKLSLNEIAMLTTAGGTTNQCTGGVSFASSMTANQGPEWALDGSDAAFMAEVSGNNGNGEWWAYQFSSVKEITGVRIKVRNNSNYIEGPKNFVLEYADGAGGWTQAGAFSTTWSSAGQEQTFTLAGSVSASVATSQAQSAAATAGASVDATASTAQAQTTAAAASAATSTAHRYWRIFVSTSSSGGFPAFSNIEMREAGGGADATFPGGTANASTTFNGDTLASYAFDADANTIWMANGATNQWVSFDFGSGNAKSITEVALTSRNDAFFNDCIATGMVQYADGDIFNPASWTTAFSISTGSWTQAQTKTFNAAGTVSYGAGATSQAQSDAATVGVSVDCTVAIGQAQTAAAAASNGAHRYWRVNVTAANGRNWVGCAKLAMRSTFGGADLCTGGTAIAQNQYDPEGQVPANAFDSDANSEWASGSGVVPVWLGYDFGAGNAKAIVEFAWTARTDSFGVTDSPSAGALQYSDDGTNWTEAFPFSGSTGWTAGETRTFRAPHRYWRLYITRTCVPSAGYVSLMEVQLRTAIGGASVATGGTASASSTDFGWVAANAFDGSTGGNGWHTAAFSSPAPQWIKYDFGSGNAKAIVECTITPQSSFSGRAPASFQLQYSDDDSTWTDLFSVVDAEPYANGEVRAFNATDTPTQGASKTFWRVRATTANSGSAGSGYFELAEVAMATSSGGANECTGGKAFHNVALNTTGFEAGNAFDGNTATYCSSNELPAYVGYRFASAKDITEVKVRGRAAGGYEPTALTIDYWDGATFQTVHTASGLSWTAGEQKTFTITSAGVTCTVATSQVQSVAATVGLAVDATVSTAQTQTSTAAGQIGVDGATATSQAQSAAATGNAASAGESVAVATAQAQSSAAQAGLATVLTGSAGQAQSSAGAAGLASSASVATRQGQRAAATGGTAIDASASSAQGQRSAGTLTAGEAVAVATSQGQSVQAAVGVAVDAQVSAQQGQRTDALATVSVDATASSAQLQTHAGEASIGIEAEAASAQTQSSAGQIALAYVVTVEASQAQTSGGSAGLSSAATVATLQAQAIQGEAGTAISASAATSQAQHADGRLRRETAGEVVTHQAQATAGELGLAISFSVSVRQGQTSTGAGATAMDCSASSGQAQSQQWGVLTIGADGAVATIQVGGTCSGQLDQYLPQVGALMARIRLYPAVQGALEASPAVVVGAPARIRPAVRGQTESRLQ
jgi:hypothetical protein